MNYYLLSIYLGIALLLGACHSPEPTSSSTHFDLIPASESGIAFQNRIEESDSFNYFTYPYLYLGGGVAVGDINGDDLPDLFFSGNMVPNALYLNRGNWQFEEIGEAAGVAGDDRWYTGVNMADVNGDGRLDLYLSVSGKDGDKRNQLFLNQGPDPVSGAEVSFQEVATEWGIADPGSSIQSTFWDYDRDGDLDLFVANYPPSPFGSSNSYYLEKMQNLQWEESDHLYEQVEPGVFKDVSSAAGIANYGLSLGVSVADFDGDGWDDLYVSNDFSTPDRMFFNNGNGTFREDMQQAMAQTSLFGMGCDAADYNNDGLIDLVQVDMNPEDNRRSKENMASMNPRLFWNTVNSGFHYQYMFNSLQLNRGKDATGNPAFSNVNFLAGMASTDWSWAPLFADLDNDGWKDLFITNGIKREVNNRDYLNSMKMAINMSQNMEHMDYRRIPSEPVENYAFRNSGELALEDKGQDWGLNLKGFSHGAIYADLDQDGDLDLVTNNMDADAGLFRNESTGHHFLQIQLRGTEGNPQGIGAKVAIKTASGSQFQQMNPTRGFQSSVEPMLHFGLGEVTTISELEIIWPDGKIQQLAAVKADQRLVLEHGNASGKVDPSSQMAMKLFQTDTLTFPYKHHENDYWDYGIEPLLPYQLSQLGPALATGDVNGDGLEDVFLGNAYNQAPSLFLQTPSGNFEPLMGPWLEDQVFEDVEASLADLDGDGDLDLYVGSGGNEFVNAPDMLRDRLYVNLGNGQFQALPNALPEFFVSTGVVSPGDLDGDGDLDLFVGGRNVPGKYPLPAQSVLLENVGGTDQALKFREVSQTWAPAFAELGMVTDAQWADINGDETQDLVIAGEWMEVTVWENEGNRLSQSNLGLAQVGWWQCLEVADLDGDGDMDLVAGNLGENAKYHASETAPFSVYSGDFDKNGRLDIVLGYQQDGNQFPLRGRQCSSEQIPAIEMKFRDYHSFAVATLPEIYGDRNLEDALQYHATTFTSVWYEQVSPGKWEAHALPKLAQISAIQDLQIRDWDGDGQVDILLAGNLHRMEVETPRLDASLGLFLQGTGQGGFEGIDAGASGVFLQGDVVALSPIQLANGHQGLIAALNSGAPRLIQSSKTTDYLASDE
ncbi:CRTAC1 family protein [Pontibacter sp. G13]|uniref:CRTAC1 family protein n=1 Tax=Pontibacter sp. G13 TaxID=3074898 RepID=UPI00288B7593|nr:CRTAC1 family protein [Pontibacter sp. G13]WNJ19106.1 CRTAC1 family protein [Pontibacter sp. G13]